MVDYVAQKLFGRLARLLRLQVFVEHGFDRCEGRRYHHDNTVRFTIVRGPEGSWREDRLSLW